MSPPDLRARVLALFHDEGFDTVRIASADLLADARESALRAHADGNLAGLDWMTPGWLDRATNPAAFLPGARSVILAGLPNHTPPPTIPADSPTRGKVARYAWGRDYHRVFERKLRRIARLLRQDFGAQARPTVDYGPLLERPLAAAAGMGWLGKSTMLLAPGAGPWLMLGAVATTLELAPDPPLRKTCGSCTRCITACPTGALSPDGRLDARLCISYHTIENRGDIPIELRPKFGSWVFGCDDCLDSCPVGAANTTTNPAFAPATVDDAFPTLADLLDLDDAAFDARFRGRAIIRAKRDGMARNACVALGNTGNSADLPALTRALADRSPIVRSHAAWAIEEIARRNGEYESSRPTAG